MKNKKNIIKSKYSPDADVVFFKGDIRKLLKAIPEETVQLIITSPPYNLGKEYEKRQELNKYIAEQKEIIDLCVPLLTDSGSICWQVGNYISPQSEVTPLDLLIYKIFKSHELILRNRIIWHFGHGLHSRRRFSGRYETILWFTRNTKDYYFNLDSIRIPQKYPGKRAFKGPNTGKYSGNPKGKNPSDVWEIPNVKSHHIEKTEHPCQFPIGLVQRLIKALSKEGDLVLDPFLGVGTTACAAIIEKRRAIGAEILPKYQVIAEKRMLEAIKGTLKYRPHNKPIYQPKTGSKLTIRSDEDENM